MSEGLKTSSFTIWDPCQTDLFSAKKLIFCFIIHHKGSKLKTEVNWGTRIKFCLTLNAKNLHFSTFCWTTIYSWKSPKMCSRSKTTITSSYTVHTYIYTHIYMKGWNTQTSTGKIWHEIQGWCKQGYSPPKDSHSVCAVARLAWIS